MSDVILELKDIHTYYGNIHALKGISLDIKRGEIVTLLGSNGAGKSTTLKTIIGNTRPRSGTVIFNGKDITQEKQSKIVSSGIGISPEGREVFPKLTVEENLLAGAYTRKNKSEIATSLAEAYTLFPRLKERYKQLAGTLSGGEQQMLAIGRALMCKPEILLLDEPSLGLAPNLVEFIFELIIKINKLGMTILLIEQNANMALSIADRAFVLETGVVTIKGNAKELQSNDAVKKAYLGQ